MAGGRPTKYNQGILDKANDYLVNYAEYGDQMPSHASLSLELGISRETLYEWGKQEEKQEFSDILEKMLRSQERVLFNKGLTGDFNPAIAKLALGKHGYSDKQDNTHSGGDKPIEVSGVQFVGVAVKD